MTETIDPLVMKFTPGALWYALGLIGFGRVAVPGDPFAGWQTEAVQEQMQVGKRLLEERSFLYDTPAGEVAVDADFAEMLRIIAKPPYFVEAQTIAPFKTPLHLAIYPSQASRLVLEWSGLEYILSLFPPGLDNTSMLLARMGFAGQPQHTASLPAIAAGPFESLLQAAFAGPAVLERFLTQNGSTKAQQAWAQPYLSHIQFLTRLTLFTAQNGKRVPMAQRIYVGNAQALWRVTETGHLLSFRPVSAQSLIDRPIF